MLSIITIGLLACIASAGTLAYFQDTITSTGNGVTAGKLVTQYSKDGGVNRLPIPSGVDSFTVTGNTVQNIIPKAGTTTIQQLMVLNSGTSSARMKVIIQALPTIDEQIQGLTIYSGTYGSYTTLYSNGAFTPAALSGIDTDAFEHPANPVFRGSGRILDLVYEFPDNGNQNSQEGKTVKFDLKVTMKAVP